MNVIKCLQTLAWNKNKKTSRCDNVLFFMLRWAYERTQKTMVLNQKSAFIPVAHRDTHLMSTI